LIGASHVTGQVIHESTWHGRDLQTSRTLRCLCSVLVRWNWSLNK